MKMSCVNKIVFWKEYNQISTYLWFLMFPFNVLKGCLLLRQKKRKGCWVKLNEENLFKSISKLSFPQNPQLARSGFEQHWNISEVVSSTRRSNCSFFFWSDSNNFRSVFEKLTTVTKISQDWNENEYMIMYIHAN